MVATRASSAKRATGSGKSAAAAGGVIVQDDFDEPQADAPSLPTNEAGEIEFDPPLGKMPPFTFTHPVLHGASQRWRKGGGTAGLLAILRNGDNIKSFRAFLRFSAAMFLVPAITMLLAFTVVFDRVYPIADPTNRMAYAGIAAACSVQLVICAFIVHAFRETPGEPSAEKKDA